MKKIYEAPNARYHMLGAASFLATSGEPGDAIREDIFGGGDEDYGMTVGNFT